MKQLSMLSWAWKMFYNLGAISLFTQAYLSEYLGDNWYWISELLMHDQITTQ